MWWGANPLDMSVHANEQWLKAYIAQQWFSLLMATRGVPANKDGEARGDDGDCGGGDQGD